MIQMKVEIFAELVAALKGFLHADPNVFKAELEAAHAALARVDEDK